MKVRFHTPPAIASIAYSHKSGSGKDSSTPPKLPGLDSPGGPKSITSRTSDSAVRLRRQQNQALAGLLSSTLCSESFMETLHRFPPRAREWIIGHAIEYHVIFRDGGGFDAFMELHRDAVVGREHEPFIEYKNGEPLVQVIADHLGIKDLQTVAAQREVYDFYFDRFCKGGFVFHGFNGAAEPLILKNGLHPDLRLWDEDEVNRVVGIFRKYNRSPLFHWKPSTVHYAGGPLFTYYYATRAPAIFGEIYDFIAGGEDIHAFSRRDYPTAYRVVLGHCRKCGLSASDERQVMGLFNRMWETLAGPDAVPKLALIERDAAGIVDDHSFDTFCRDEAIEDDGWGEEEIRKLDSARVAIEFTREWNHDVHINNVISPDRFVIVNLPSYNSVLPIK